MWDKAVDLYCRLATAAMALCLAAMVLMVFGNVVLRYGFNSGLTVSEELSRWLFLWLVFLGAAVAVRERAHMGSDALLERLPRRVRQPVQIVAQSIVLSITGLVLAGSWQQMRINWDTQAPVTGASMAWVYATGVVFGIATGAMQLVDLVRLLRSRPADESSTKAPHAP